MNIRIDNDLVERMIKVVIKKADEGDSECAIFILTNGIKEIEAEEKPSWKETFNFVLGRK
jgi:hypothetical protein